MTHRCILVVPALVLIVTLAAPALAAIPPLPEPLFGNESVAATDGAWGFAVNPAAGGLRYPSELLIAYTGLEPSGQTWRGAYGKKGVGLTGVLTEGGAKDWGAAGGGGEDRMRMGFAFHRLSGTGDNVTDYTLGLLSRPAPWLSLGAVGDHLTQPRGDLHRVYTLGVAIRPLAMMRTKAHNLGTKFTLSADVAIAEDGPLEASRVRVGGEIELADGLAVRGAMQDHGSYQLGLSLRSTRAAYHGSAAYTSTDSRTSMTHAVSIHQGEERSVFTGPNKSRVAVVRVGGVLGDDALSGFTLTEGPSATVPAAPVHKALDRALDDPLTRGVLLDLRGVGNMAQIEELRPKVAKLRAAGKPVVAYMEQGGGRGDFYLASGCDRIVASEQAFFAGLGLRIERHHYRRLLQDWGVRIDRSSTGRYKSAYRGFSVDSTPPADREALERYLDVSQELFVSAVASDRKMDRARLLTVLDGRPWTTRELQQAGMLDSIGYREDAMRVLGQLAGLGRKPRGVNLNRLPLVERAWTVPQRVAVVYATGAIESGRSGNDLLLGPYMGSETVARQLEQAFRHPEVKSVVLRVESPGGSGLASNVIDHTVQRLKRETGKPIIVSMGSVAGSGGYYISAHGDRIFADRYTRTGSIGVVTLKPSFEGWYEKHDVHEDAFERGRHMVGLSTSHDWDRERQALADSAVMDHYRGFVAKVADGRRMSWAQVDSVAQGRVWMGEDARERGLVDEIGGLDAAIAEARRRADIPAGEKIRLVEYRRPRPFWARWAGSAMSTLLARSAHVPSSNAFYYLAEGDLAE